eukprot:m.245203 g.245203  ORF g.245203 m.245203 type:complete len:884 (+) comp14627_c0_seq1:44-2695(+)
MTEVLPPPTGAGTRLPQLLGSAAAAVPQMASKSDAPVALRSVTMLPAIVHIGGFEIEKIHRVTLKLLNTATAPIRYYLTPPKTPFFSIKYQKRDVFVPGTQELIELEFIPTEHRYFYDTIEVHVETGETLVVPMHAYPVLSAVELPSLVDFGTCPIQMPAVKAFNIKCDVPIEFEYKIKVISSHPAIAIAPLAGTIPARGHASISVTYTPSDYTTASAIFELLLSQYNSKPVRCTVLGSCTPGALRDAAVAGVTQRLPRSPQRRDSASALAAARPPSTRDGEPRAPTTRDEGRTRTVRREATRPATSRENGADSAGTMRVRNMAAVNAILNQTSTKAPSAPLAGAAYRRTHHALQLQFQREIKQYSAKSAGLGEDELSHEARREILAARRIMEEQYQATKGEGATAAAAALARAETINEAIPRGYRYVTADPPAITPVFSTQPPRTLAQRMASLARFVQAARRVILQARLAHRLRILTRVKQTAKLEGARVSSIDDDVHALTIVPPKLLARPVLPVLDTSTMPITYPRVTLPSVKPAVPSPPSGFLELQLPQQYILLGYPQCQPYDTLYLPTEAIRPLRRGEEPQAQVMQPQPPKLEPRNGSARTPASRASTTMRKSIRPDPAAAAALTASVTTSSASVSAPLERVPSMEIIALTIPPQLTAPNPPPSALLPITPAQPVLQPMRGGETDEGHLLDPYCDITVPHARVLNPVLSVDILPDMALRPEPLGLSLATANASLARFWIPRSTDPFQHTLPLTGPAFIEAPLPGDTLAPLPVPPLQGVFTIPEASERAMATAEVNVVNSEGEHSRTSVPTTFAGIPNYAGPQGLLVRAEREAVCEAGARLADTMASRIEQRAVRLVRAQAPPKSASVAAPSASPSEAKP